MINLDSFLGCSIIKELSNFIELSSLIIANRLDDHIEGAVDKLFTRDIFRNN